MIVMPVGCDNKFDSFGWIDAETLEVPDRGRLI
jgi:hypothetical protein